MREGCSGVCTWWEYTNTQRTYEKRVISTTPSSLLAWTKRGLPPRQRALGHEIQSNFRSSSLPLISPLTISPFPDGPADPEPAKDGTHNGFRHSDCCRGGGRLVVTIDKIWEQLRFWFFGIDVNVWKFESSTLLLLWTCCWRCCCCCPDDDNERLVGTDRAIKVPMSIIMAIKPPSETWRVLRIRRRRRLVTLVVFWESSLSFFGSLLLMLSRTASPADDDEEEEEVVVVLVVVLVLVLATSPPLPPFLSAALNFILFFWSCKGW